MQATTPAPAIDLDAAWRLAPGVAVRPERAGGLLYHFGTRRLSFLKDPALLAVVGSLASEPTARAACARAGIAERDLPRYEAALAALARSELITERGDG